MNNYEYYDRSEGNFEETAKRRAAMEREFGMPSQPHCSGPLGDRVNQLHREYEAYER